jgi:hypothetical protein
MGTEPIGEPQFPKLGIDPLRKRLRQLQIVEPSVVPQPFVIAERDFHLIPLTPYSAMSMNSNFSPLGSHLTGTPLIVSRPSVAGSIAQSAFASVLF